MKGFQKALAGLFLLPAPAFAGDPASSQSASAVPAPISQGDTDLRMLLREVRARLHEHFVTDPRVRQTVEEVLMGGVLSA